MGRQNGYPFLVLYLNLYLYVAEPNTGICATGREHVVAVVEARFDCSYEKRVSILFSIGTNHFEAVGIVCNLIDKNVISFTVTKFGRLNVTSLIMSD